MLFRMITLCWLRFAAGGTTIGNSGSRWSAREHIVVKGINIRIIENVNGGEPCASPGLMDQISERANEWLLSQCGPSVYLAARTGMIALRSPLVSSQWRSR